MHVCAFSAAIYPAGQVRPMVSAFLRKGGTIIICFILLIVEKYSDRNYAILYYSFIIAGKLRFLKRAMAGYYKYLSISRLHLKFRG